MAEFNIDLAALTPEEEVQLEAHFKAIEDIMEKKLKYLTGDERRGTLKMGDNAESMITETVEYMKTHPVFIPAYQNPEVLPRLIAETKKYNKLVMYFKTMTNNSESTNLLIKELMVREGLMYYRNVNSAVVGKIKGAKEVQDSLSRHYDHYGPKKGPKEKDDDTSSSTDSNGTTNIGTTNNGTTEGSTNTTPPPAKE